MPKSGSICERDSISIAQKFDAKGHVVVGGIDLDHIAAHAEGAAAQVAVVAFVENLNQLAGNVFALDALAFFEQEQHAVIGFWRAKAVNATDAGDDDAVATFKERARGGKTKLVELIVDGGFFFDVDVAGGNVGFRLVVVVVGDEIFDRVLREEMLELVIELGGESFVVGHDQGRAV